MHFTAGLLCCLPTRVRLSFHQTAQLSWFIRFCSVSAKPVTRKVRLEVHSVPQCLPSPGRQLVLAGAVYENTLGKWEFTLQAWGVWTVNMALRLVLEYSLKDRGQVLFEGYNWTIWIDPNRMYRICFKRHHQTSVHCNNKRNLFSFSTCFNFLIEDLFFLFFFFLRSLQLCQPENML